MESYTEQKFLKLVADRDDLNFLAAAITPWHVLGIEASIYQLQEKGIELKGYIMIVTHPVTGTIIREEDFHSEFHENIEIILLKSQSISNTIQDKIRNKIVKCFYYWRHKQESKKTLYWIVPLKPSYDLIPKIAHCKKDDTLKIMIADEGLGSYLNTAYTWWRFSFIESGIKAGMKATFRLFISENYFMHRLRKRNQVSYNQLLKGKRGKWVPNEEVIAAYRKVLERKTCKEDVSYYSKAVIINSDMFYESGLLSSMRDLEIYTQVCDAMQEKKIPVVLKNHPRERKIERYQKLKCYREEKSGIAQENIFATLREKPYCIIGVGTTSLVTAKIIFGIEAISINNLIDKRDLKNKDAFKSFNQTFANLLYMPDTIEKLIENIDKIKTDYEEEQNYD